MSQMTFNWEPNLPERFPSLRAYVAHRSSTVRKPPKVQAADMDIAPSTLSRKLNPAEGDTHTPYLARLFALLNPQHGCLFEFREAKAAKRERAAA